MRNNITSVSNNNQERIHIHDNTIQVTNLPNAANSKMGISLDRSRFGNDNEYRNTIDRNHFIIHEFAGSERRAMHIRGGASIHDYMRIDSNFIEAKAGGNSDILTKFVDIDISGAENFHITNNTLNTTNTFATGNNRWGFFMVNGATTPAEGNKFWLNTITGIGPDDGCCAVHALDAGPWSICSNTTDQTYRGFHFTGNCGKSVFGLNTFNNHNYDPLQLYVGGTGLFMQGHGADNAFLGIQECQSNHWEIVDYAFPNAYTAIIIGNELNGPSNPTLQKNEFRVENLNDAHQAPIDRNPMQNWFKTGECLQAPTGCVEQDLNTFDEHDIWVRDHYPYPQATPGVEEWQSTRYVLAKLMRYPNLASGATLTFRNAYSQSSAALFARFDSLMNAISLATTASQTTLNGIYANIQSKQAQINALDATVSDYSAIPIGMLSDRAVLLGELAALTVQLNTLQAQNESVRLPLLAACEQFNNTLPANQAYEQNQKVLNALAIQQARGIELSETDKSALHAIAQQCTQVAGRTKEAASAMLPPEESGPYWHEDPNVDNCPQRTSRDAKLQDFGCTLSPNPVSDMLRLQFDGPFVGTLVISDLSGRVIQQLDTGEQTNALDIPVNQLINGVYLITCTDQAKNWSASSKFVVLR
ncbi:MAG TPA: T9SS type A sorting domain-containing protein [Saprospiraceae bacterium]|nr:T9SS type A sorting domain-containing protein [Saprospiraceae bacterium]